MKHNRQHLPIYKVVAPEPNLAQLEKIYGRFDKSSIISNCNTRIAFREISPEAAKEISVSFGSMEIVENQEGISYGANTVRDGVTLSSMEKNKSVVSSNDIKSAADFQAYLSMPLKKPMVTKIKIPFVDVKNSTGKIDQFIKDEKKISTILQRTLTAEEMEKQIEDKQDNDQQVVTLRVMNDKKISELDFP